MGLLTMADVVLVMPVEGFWSDLRKGHHLPASLLAASTLLDKENYDVKIIDQRVSPEWEDDLRKELSKKPLFVGVTSMTGPQIKNALDISMIVKEYEVPVVWGGVHASLLPSQTLENECIDMVVVGEGEVTLLELARALEKQKPMAGINGLWYKKGKKIVKNPPRQFIDLNEIPDLPYHLVDINQYFSNFYGSKMLAFFSSRGCPFTCGFCYNTVYNQRKWRSLSAQNTLERLDYVINKFKLEGIWFRDDNFFVDKKRAYSILNGFKKYDISWGTSGARLDLLSQLDNKFIDLMNKSGCKFLFIGVESGSDRILKLIGKGITREQIIKTNLKLRRLNAIQRCNIMIGLPTETKKDLEDTVSLSLQILKDNKNAIVSQFQIFTPYPGTALFDMAVKQGFVPPDNLASWSDFRFETTNIEWSDKDTKDILRMLAFTSWFMDTKLEGLAKNRMLKFMAKMYAPLALYRLKNLDARFPLEIKLAERIGF